MTCNSSEAITDGGLMSCLSCASDQQAEISAEMIIHFSGLQNLDNPGVRAFPKLQVCLVCGFCRFTVPKSELPFLAIGGLAGEAATQGTAS
jgi:hypothetical protein